MAAITEIRARDWDRCINCGSSRDLHVHHRRLRSQGGPNTFSNQITLCTYCHSYAHGHPNDARTAGFILFHGDDPALTPVCNLNWPGRKVWLMDDGTIAFFHPHTDEPHDPDDWYPLPTTGRK